MCFYKNICKYINIIYENIIKLINKNTNTIIISPPKLYIFNTLSDPNLIPGTVTKYDKVTGTYIIYHDNTNYSASSLWSYRLLIVEDIMYEYTITSINQNKNEITLTK
jgi:hypothetical protein